MNEAEHMGGWGSTRWEGHVPATPVEACLPLDAADLKAAGAFALPPGAAVRPWKDACLLPWVRSVRREPGALRLRYSVWVECLDGQRRAAERTQRIGLMTTRPHFGGVRHWLRCPACEGRRRVLWLPPRHSACACRTCYGLTYRSSQFSGFEAARWHRPEQARKRTRRLVERYERAMKQPGAPAVPDMGGA